MGTAAVLRTVISRARHSQSSNSSVLVSDAMNGNEAYQV
jgi:hypothetical protein